MKHLEDHELTAAVEGFVLEGEAADHLAACISCRRDVTTLREAVAERRLELEHQAPDWANQREEIMARLPTSATGAAGARRRWPRLLMAAAAAVVAAVGLSSLWDAPMEPQPVAGGEIAIEEILAEVDAVLADDTLPGFEVIDPWMDDPESVEENGTS